MRTRPRLPSAVALATVLGADVVSMKAPIGFLAPPRGQHGKQRQQRRPNRPPPSKSRNQQIESSRNPAISPSVK